MTEMKIADKPSASNPDHIRVIADRDQNLHYMLHRIFNDRIPLIGEYLQGDICLSLGTVDNGRAGIWGVRGR